MLPRKGDRNGRFLGHHFAASCVSPSASKHPLHLRSHNVISAPALSSNRTRSWKISSIRSVLQTTRSTAMTTRTIAVYNGNAVASTSSQYESTALARPIEGTRIYKEYFRPALHRRFTVAASVLLFFCWLDASILNISTQLLWRWFPVGTAGLHTLLLSGPCLAVFIVHVFNIHVGVDTTTSLAETIYAQLTSVTGMKCTLYTLK